MVTDPGAHRLRRHSEQALRFPCVGWMAETGIVDEASWTGRDTSKRQELPRFKHDLPHPTSLESGKVFRNHESSDSPLAVPYQINPFGFSMQANFVRMRGLTPFAFPLVVLRKMKKVRTQRAFCVVKPTCAPLPPATAYDLSERKVRSQSWNPSQIPTIPNRPNVLRQLKW